MLAVPKVLLVASEGSDRELLQEILAPHVELTCVGDSREMTRQIELVDYDAVFCAGDLCREESREVAEEARRTNPNLPVIVLSASASEAEWPEILSTGVFDLLAASCCGWEPLPVAERSVLSYETRVQQGNTAAKRAVAI